MLHASSVLLAKVERKRNRSRHRVERAKQMKLLFIYFSYLTAKVELNANENKSKAFAGCLSLYDGIIAVCSQVTKDFFKENKTISNALRMLGYSGEKKMILKSRISPIVVRVDICEKWNDFRCFMIISLIYEICGQFSF